MNIRVIEHVAGPEMMHPQSKGTLSNGFSHVANDLLARPIAMPNSFIDVLMTTL